MTIFSLLVYSSICSCISLWIGWVSNFDVSIGLYSSMLSTFSWCTSFSSMLVCSLFISVQFFLPLFYISMFFFQQCHHKSECCVIEQLSKNFSITRIILFLRFYLRYIAGIQPSTQSRHIYVISLTRYRTSFKFEIFQAACLFYVGFKFWCSATQFLA